MIDSTGWKWYGCAGHFICGQWCRFHLCTEIGGCLISTLGEYVHPRHSGGSEQDEAKWLAENYPGEDIGADRKYETMVFKTSGKRCENTKCGCGLPDYDGFDLDFDGYNTAGDAMRGHMEMCKKWAAKDTEDVE